jgi:hypothetical protein
MGGKLFMAPLEKVKVKVRIGVKVIENPSLTPSRKLSTLAQEQVRTHHSTHNLLSTVN